MKNCINCGAEMQDDVNFCPACGASQVAQEQAKTEAQPQPQQPYYGQPQQPYYGQPQPYAQQPYVPQPQAQGPAKPVSGVAITGLVFACLTWVFCYMGIIGIAIGLVGLICSAVGVAKKQQYRAPGIAIAGLVIACIALFITIILTIIFGYLGIFTIVDTVVNNPYYPHY